VERREGLVGGHVRYFSVGWQAGGAAGRWTQSYAGAGECWAPNWKDEMARIQLGLSRLARRERKREILDWRGWRGCV
jgi:hypothetical protein